jgi:hypothetical protein
MNPNYTFYYKLDFGPIGRGETKKINPILKSKQHDTPVYMTNQTNGEMYIVGSWKDPHWKHYPADRWPSIRHQVPRDLAATNFIPPGIRTSLIQFRVPTDFPQRINSGAVNRAMYAVYSPTMGTDSYIYAELLNEYFKNIDRLRPWESLPPIIPKPPPLRKFNVNRYISDALNEIASEKKEKENRSWFAFRAAAKAIYDLDYEITPWNLENLKKVKGIGKVMFDIIKNMLPDAMRTWAAIID